MAVVASPEQVKTTADNSILDRLHALGPHEIQVGILKRLKGTPIRRHTKAFEMTYSPLPPFEIMRTSVLSYEELN